MTNQNAYYTSLPSADVVLNSIPDSILVVSKERVILYANAAAEALFEKSFHQLIGSHFDYSLSAAHCCHLAIERKDGMRTVHLLCSVMQWDEQQVYLVCMRDLTELPATLKEIEDKNKELEAANAELIQHASLTSHDLKEPVRKIRIYVDRILQKDGELDQQTRAQVVRIGQSADRLKSLIGGINELAPGAHPSQDFQELDLERVVQNVLQDLDLAIMEKKAEIEVDSLPVVQAIPSQMHRLFLNLVLNAIKYSKPYSTPRISINAKEHKTFVTISVKDNGIGIRQEFAEKIFDPFVRLHTRNVEGSGIGLAICKKIVAAHGGTISVTSKEGEGSCFLFSLGKRPGLSCTG